MEETAKKILYIEDDTSSRLLVKKILAGRSLEFYEAKDGMSGLKLARRIVPDLILLDLHLPDISGTELATKIKSLRNLEKTVIVALTSAQDPDIREMSLIAGCDGYLSKPILTKTFPQQIEDFLKGKREKIDAHKREILRQKYQETIVDDLTLKVEQLQKANRRLKGQSEKLKDYSLKLETLLHIIIDLQLSESPRVLKEKLVREICNKFQFDRCAFLEADYETMMLKVTAICGFERKELENIEIEYKVPVFQRLFRKNQVLFFSSPDKIPDPQSQKMLRRINTHQFLVGNLGTPIPGNHQVSLEENLGELLKDLIPHLYGQRHTDINIIQEHLREYLSSEFFYFGGYIFVDYKDPSKRFSRYDIKILEMLLRTASLLYQNLRMREQLKEFFVRAEKDAITDHLTELFNFRYFTHQLAREFNRARRHHSEFALVMLDIDFFKHYNDTLGHQAGDIVLKKVAGVLKQNTRNSDFVARYGGEEFAIICPETGKEEGRKIAEKLCNIIAATAFPREEMLAHQKVTISVGVAVYPGDAQTPQELIRSADVALYQAKQKGRNQVQLYEANMKLI
jgi:diguanylate cyclase (GGDEF)-like protein